MTIEENTRQSRSRQELECIEAILNSNKMQRVRQVARAGGQHIVPKNAASILLIRGKPGKEEIIMGKRNGNLKFMPGALVFPGGRVDPGDWRIPASAPLDSEVRAKLMAAMRGKPGAKSAHALGIAALRELFEETGFLIGHSSHTLPAHKDWTAYAERKISPDLSGLRLLARAITPPGMPRRFDTWFFVMRLAEHHIEPESGFVHSSELEELRWIRPEEAMSENTREITRVILIELIHRLKCDPDLTSSTMAPGYRTINNRFCRELI